MGKWILLWWIRGCAGLGCEVPDYNFKEYATEDDCNSALEIVMQLSPKPKKRTSTFGGNTVETWDHKGTHVGICVNNINPELLRDVKEKLEQGRSD